MVLRWFKKVLVVILVVCSKLFEIRTSRTGPGPPGQVRDLQEHLQDIQKELQDLFRRVFNGFSWFNVGL